MDDKMKRLAKRKDLSRDLLFSRKGAGFKLYRLYTRIDDLISHLNLEVDSPFSIVENTFIGKIMLIQDPLVSEALLMNFGLDPKYNHLHLLNLRRAQFAREKSISIDKVRVLENSGINELIRILLQDK